MEKLLTIVIPAYNMEALLPRCLNSICSEKVMDRVQVLVMNDGSKDRTSEIAHSFELRYPNYVTVIDKPNGNYGSCMNMGLALAKGKYFRTLDADDWYDTQAYEKFVDELENSEADMVICERSVYYEKDTQLVHEYFKDNLTFNKDISANKSLWLDVGLTKFECVQCICYKTQVLKDCKMRWSENVFYTDTEYDYFPLRTVKTVRLIPLPVYIYLMGRDDQSMSSKSIARNFHSLYIVSNRVVSDFVAKANPKSEIYPLQRKYLFQILPYFYSNLLFDGFKNRKEIDEVDNKLKSCPQIYEETNNLWKHVNYSYVNAYRHNKFKFIFIYADYKLRLFINSIMNFLHL